MNARTEWKARRDALTERMKALQAAIIARDGALSLPVYRAELEACGLAAEWAALQTEPGNGPDICKVEKDKRK